MIRIRPLGVRSPVIRKFVSYLRTTFTLYPFRGRVKVSGGESVREGEPCTCTLACNPAAITDNQWCREAASCELPDIEGGEINYATGRVSAHRRRYPLSCHDNPIGGSRIGA